MGELIVKMEVNFACIFTLWPLHNAKFMFSKQIDFGNVIFCRNIDILCAYDYVIWQNESLGTKSMKSALDFEFHLFANYSAKFDIKI